MTETNEKIDFVDPQVFLVKCDTHQTADKLTVFFQEMLDKKRHLIKVEDLGGLVKFTAREGVEPAEEKEGVKKTGKKKKSKPKKKWGKIGAPHSAKRKAHMRKIRKK